jgi:hypothetical protein
VTSDEGESEGNECYGIGMNEESKTNSYGIGMNKKSKTNSYRDLNVWQKGITLVKLVYLITHHSSLITFSYDS